MTPKYQPKTCESCGQTTTYELVIDRGTVDILKAISMAIRKKGVNIIHPRKEMEVTSRQVPYEEMVRDGHLTSNQVGNLSRARFHGLIAAVKGKSGTYCLTPKGAGFLRGEEIPRIAIISKAEGHNIGYFEEATIRCTIRHPDLAPEKEYWIGHDYLIQDGRVITGVQIPTRQPISQTSSLFAHSNG